ncbi:MAG: hypothetical protein ABW140_06680, partial [Candidatus Sedimenticola sp. 6PFRAG1]
MAGMNGMSGMSGMSGNNAMAKDQIDSWSKAHQISTAWLKLSGFNGVSVGRIRKVNKIYIVSIVASESPHGLRNQLIIRTTDGYTSPVF